MPDYYRSIINSLPTPILVVDAQGIVVDFNTHYLSILCDGRCNHDELMNKAIVTHPVAVQNGLNHVYRELLDGASDHLNNIQVFNGDENRQLHVNITVHPVELSQNIQGTLFVHKDVSNLKESEKELRKILENMQDTYYRTDLEGRIERASSSVYELLGYQIDEVMGLKISDLYVDPYERQRLLQLLEQTDGKVQEFEAQLRRKDGEIIWVSTNAHYHISKGKVKGIEGTTRDITRLKKIEEELKNHRKHLEHLVAERTEELESFSYSVSHDLRSPLRSINGFGHALEEEYGHLLDDAGKDYLRRVRSSTSHMADLIDDLLQLTMVNRQALVMEKVNVAVMVEAILADLKKANPERAVKTIIAPDVAVQGDARLLTIALRNLLENAWKYTSKTESAQIEFGVSDMPAESPVYFVRDNGVGLEMKYANKLFKPFQRLHKLDEFEGTGIGLAIVNRVFTRHGGSVWVEAEPGEGAVFYFTVLPNSAYL
jgi:PAS domain S-box-containing protein